MKGDLAAHRRAQPCDATDRAEKDVNIIQQNIALLHNEQNQIAGSLTHMEDGARVDQTVLFKNGSPSLLRAESS